MFLVNILVIVCILIGGFFSLCLLAMSYLCSCAICLVSSNISQSRASYPLSLDSANGLSICFLWQRLDSSHILSKYGRGDLWNSMSVWKMSI